MNKILTKTGYDGFVTKFQYNAANRLTSMSNPDHLQVSYFYDGAGRLINRILSNDVKSFYQYDNDNRLTLLLNEGGQGVEVSRTAYSYDGAGNITQVATGPTGAVQTDYTYDVMNRLTNVDAPGAVDDEAYTYDKVGNRLSSSEGGTSFAYVSNANNQLLSVRLGTLVTDPIFYSYTYDENGNRLQKLDEASAVLQSYVYDQKNRIATLSVGADSLAFQYDPNDYRTQLHSTGASTQTRNYYLEAEHLEAITDASGEFTDRYFRGVVVDEIVHGYHTDTFETAITFHHDHLRSVTSSVDRLGAELSTASYGPFGGLLSETGDDNGNRLRYTGRELDEESGLYYYRARYYDTQVGRFITEDPIGFNAGVNFYAYVNNNPLRYNDPLGLDGADFFRDPNSPRKMGMAPNKNRVLNATEDNVPFMFETSVRHDQLLNSIGIPDVKANPFTMLMNVVTMPIAAADGIISNVLDTLTFEQLDFGVDNFSLPAVINSFSSPEVVGPQSSLGGLDPTSVNPNGASGGFVIYPNKPNNNMMQRVYSK